MPQRKTSTTGQEDRKDFTQKEEHRAKLSRRSLWNRDRFAFWTTQIMWKHPKKKKKKKKTSIVLSYKDNIASLDATLTCINQYSTKKQTNKLHGLSPRANYTDRATAACLRSDCQLLRIEGATWSE
jgi:hypothetical protein